MEELPPNLQTILLTDVDVRTLANDTNLAGLKLATAHSTVWLVATRPMLLELARQAQIVGEEMPKEI